jgi:hypothetical protein
LDAILTMLMMAALALVATLAGSETNDLG